MKENKENVDKLRDLRNGYEQKLSEYRKKLDLAFK
jgi:uncharacterized coiled-coil DUF342 family protein